MAEIYGPFDSGPGASFGEDGWAKLMRAMARDGIIYQHSTEITSPYVGPGLNGLLVSLSGGLDVSVGVGVANVHGFMYENTAVITRTVTTPPTTAGQSRLDLVVVRVDKTTNTATVAIRAGTASTTPVDPPLSRTPTEWEMPLARITVPASAVNLSTIADMRFFPYVPAELVPPGPKISGSQLTGTFTPSEAKDTQIGDYVFTAVPGRRYRVEARVRIQAAVAGQAVDLRIRDSGSASSPTIASQLLAAQSHYIAATTGAGAIPGSVTREIGEGTTRLLTPGTHTIALFAEHTAGGTSNISLEQSSGGFKELWVEDITP